jgi:hypothetical protein
VLVSINIQVHQAPHSLVHRSTREAYSGLYICDGLSSIYLLMKEPRWMAGHSRRISSRRERFILYNSVEINKGQVIQKEANRS